MFFFIVKITFPGFMSNFMSKNSMNNNKHSNAIPT